MYIIGNWYMFYWCAAVIQGYDDVGLTKGHLASKSTATTVTKSSLFYCLNLGEIPKHNGLAKHVSTPKSN